MSQCQARTAALMFTPRSPSTSSTLCSENGMIFPPRQWWASVASSMNASCVDDLLAHRRRFRQRDRAGQVRRDPDRGHLGVERAEERRVVPVEIQPRHADRADLPVEHEVAALVEHPPGDVGGQERDALGEPGRADDEVGGEPGAVIELRGRRAAVVEEPGDGPVDHELRHVDVGGVRTRVLRAGSGPDLVLLHGTGGHLEAYARDIAGLAADFRVTAYDMVGHGWSDLPDRPYTIDVLCDHLIGLMDALDIGAAHLSGESLGGWVAAWAAAHHPDRVGRLVLNTPGNIANKPEVMARLRDSTLAAVRDPSDATVRRRVEFLFHHTEMVTDELVTLRRAVYSRPGFLRAITNTLVLQDPEIRKDFAWDPGWVGKIDRADPAAVDRPRPDRRPRRGGDAARLAARRPAARDRGRGPLAAVGEAGRVPARAP